MALKKRGQVWWIDHTNTTTGERIRESLRCREKVVAQRRHDERVRELQDRADGVVGPHGDCRRQPLAAMVDLWHDDILARGKTEHYADNVRRYALRVFADLGVDRWPLITTESVQRWMADRRDDGLAPRTINHYAVALKSFAGWLHRTQRAPRHLLIGLQKLEERTDIRVRRRAMTEDEVEALYNACISPVVRFGLTGAERYRVYRTALETGFRASEISSLTVGAVDLSEGTITVEAGAKGNKRKRRDVQPVRDAFVEELTEWVDGRDKSEPLLRLCNVSNLSKMLRQDLEAAGIDYEDRGDGRLDFHALRHTYITRLTQSDMPVKTAQTLARHSDIRQTLDRYSHVVHRDAKTALDQIVPSVCRERVPTGPKRGTIHRNAKTTEGSKPYKNRGLPPSEKRRGCRPSRLGVARERLQHKDLRANCAVGVPSDLSTNAIHSALKVMVDRLDDEHAEEALSILASMLTDQRTTPPIQLTVGGSA